KIHRYFDLPAILLRIVAIRLCRRYRGGVAGFVFLRPGRAVRIFLLKRNGLGAKRGGYTGNGHTGKQPDSLAFGAGSVSWHRVSWMPVLQCVFPQLQCFWVREEFRRRPTRRHPQKILSSKSVRSFLKCRWRIGRRRKPLRDALR